MSGLFSFTNTYTNNRTNDEGASRISTRLMNSSPNNYANLFKYINTGQTRSFMSAIANVRDNLCEILDTYGNTLLHVAIMNNNEEIVKYLLPKNFNLNLQNYEGNDIIMLCRSNRISKLLSDHLSQQNEFDRLSTRLKTYEESNRQLTDTVSLYGNKNQILTSENNRLSIDVTVFGETNKQLKRKIERLEKDNLDLCTKNKQLIDENERCNKRLKVLTKLQERT